MKLRMASRSYNGGPIEPGTFVWYVGVSSPQAKEVASDGLATPKSIMFVCPNGKRVCCLEVTTGDAIHPKWHWNGDLESPTLSPSIGCQHRCGWHGHMTDGELTP